MKTNHLILIICLSSSIMIYCKKEETTVAPKTPIEEEEMDKSVSTLITNISADALGIDKEGNLFVSDFFGANGENGTTVLKVDKKNLSISTLSSTLSQPTGSLFDEEGNIFINNYSGKIVKISKDGVQSDYVTGLNTPSGITKDSKGRLHVSSYNANKIYKIDSLGVASTWVSNQGLNGPVGMASDGQDQIYVSNFNNGKVFKINTLGDISILATVPGISASKPLGYITFNGTYLFLSASGLNKIYKLTLQGELSVFAGTGSSISTDGARDKAGFNQPNGITASLTGDTLYVSEIGSKTIRIITGANK